MNREEIIRMARKYGCVIAEDGPDSQCEVCFHAEQIAAMVLAAVEAEREACAKVCDGLVDAEYKTGKVDHNEMGWTQACATAIRARGNE